MTSEKLKQERAEFENWFLSHYEKASRAYLVMQINGERYADELAHAAFLAWRAGKVQQSVWISVKERQPELNKEVLVAWSNGSVGIARHIKDEFEPVEWNIYGSHVHITHWQPLPEPIQNSTGCHDE